jgi:AAT family amino acid transporter/aromatic amino acid transport protein AroP
MHKNLKLKNRHLQMIALGGAIGTGLFFSTATSIHLTGPSLVLSYILGGLVLYIIMRAVGEMTVDYPCPGAFSEYANRYIGSYAGFISGWSAWFEYTVVCMVEVTASTVFIDYLIPWLPHWILCLAILIFFTSINLLSIRTFGEFEFWFAGVKIVAIILMILFTVYLVIFDHKLNPDFLSYAKPSIFFAGGFKGFAASCAIVIFSFGGSEFVSIAASETENPAKNVPKAINGVIFRIILFYVLTILAIIFL